MFLTQYGRPTQTPQASRMPGSIGARQVANAAGGYVFALEPWLALDRFLILGTQGGTYYASEQKLTEANLGVVAELIVEDGPRVVSRVLEISEGARALKQDYGLYVLALTLAAKDQATRQAAYLALPRVCRTASTLFQVLAYLKGKRGWSRGLRSAVAAWYNVRPIDAVGYQMLKYGQRNGYTHRDVLRLAHPQPDTPQRSALYRFATHGDVPNLESGHPYPNLALAKNASAVTEQAERAAIARRLPREALPTEWLNEPYVWEALLYGNEDTGGMPMTALIRNLGNLSKCGLLTSGSDAERYVVGELMNATRIAKSRVHPLALYLAAITYGSGAGARGKGTWAPVGAVVDALEYAFATALGNVYPTGKNVLVAVDASGSMSAPVLGLHNVSAREIGVVMAVITAKVEPNARFIGFTDGEHGRGMAWGAPAIVARGSNNTTEFKVSPDERLRDVFVRFNAKVTPRGTDLAEPFAWAKKAGYQPDAVVIYTDGETWAGKTHVIEALADARIHRPVKLIVASTAASGTSIADPKDPDALNIAGFDANAPQAIAAFIRGEI